MNPRMIALLAKLAARGAGSVPKSATRHARQQSLNKTFPTNRSGGIGNRPNKGPVQQTTSPYENRKRQASYNKQGKLGKAISDMAEESIKKGTAKLPPHPIGDQPKSVILKKIAERVATVAGKGEAISGADRLRYILDPNIYVEEEERLKNFLDSLSPEKRAKWEEEELKQQPNLFDALSGSL